MKKRAVFGLVFLGVALAGCGGGFTDRRSPSGLSRVLESKRPGKAAVSVRRPIMAAETAGTMEVGAAVVEAAVRSDPAPGGASESPGFGCCHWEAGPTALLIVSPLRTSFSAAGAPGLSFDQQANPSGAGFQASALISLEPDDDETLVGLTAGRAHAKSRSQSRQSGGFFVRETLETEAFWTTLDIKHYPQEWAFLKAAAGLFVYSVDSRLETDAPSYDYAGLSGTRLMGGFGMGAGLETPWAFPLKAGVEAIWWFSHDQSPPIESGALQAGAHLRFKF